VTARPAVTSVLFADTVSLKKRRRHIDHNHPSVGLAPARLRVANRSPRLLRPGRAAARQKVPNGALALPPAAPVAQGANS
jgi:hypothetical protein